jgi:glutaconate CoA-transferase, subunit A
MIDDEVSAIGPSRRSHIAEIDDVVNWITDGMTVAIGGFINTGHPMALVREIIRRGRRNLTIVGAASAGLEVDLLIAAGVVAKVVTPYIGGEGLAAVGPAFRYAAQQGEIEVFELDEAHYYAGLRASAQRLPFNPWRAGVGTSLPEINPALRQFRDPVNGELLIAVPAIEIDVCLLHAAYSDIYGNVRHNGTRYGDVAISAASARTAVSVEQIIPPEATRADPRATSIDGVEAIVRAPYGAHPFAAEGFYRPDEDQLRDYVRAASDRLRSGSRAALDDYLERHVYAPKNHPEYLDQFGFARILDLYEF